MEKIDTLAMQEKIRNQLLSRFTVEEIKIYLKKLKKGNGTDGNKKHHGFALNETRLV